MKEKRIKNELAWCHCHKIQSIQYEAYHNHELNPFCPSWWKNNDNYISVVILLSKDIFIK